MHVVRERLLKAKQQIYTIVLTVLCEPSDPEKALSKKVKSYKQAGVTALHMANTVSHMS